MEKTILIRTTDASGHSEQNLSLTDAIANIIKAVMEQRKWSFVGSQAFNFTATSANDPQLVADAARLREVLEAAEGDVTVTLTGDLVGGANDPTVRLRITDASGHTEQVKLLSEAIAQIIDAVLKNKQWVYVNSSSFQFDEAALQDPVRLVEETQRLYRFVEEAGGEATITLTGDLVGGR